MEQSRRRACASAIWRRESENLTVRPTFYDAMAIEGITDGGPPAPLPALVTDAHLRSAVAGVRALGVAGVDVLALAPSRLGAGLRSRHAAGRAVGPDAVTDPERFAARVGAMAAEQGGAVVYPGQEAAIDALLAAPAPLLDKVVLPYADPGSLAAVRDKRLLAELSSGVGLGAPGTLFEGAAAELREAEVSLPLVLKPARPGGSLQTARPIDSREELHGELALLPADEPVLVQERAPGPLTAVAMVVDEGGKVVARFQQEARRTWPPGAGPSSLAVSVAPDERLVSRSARLLSEVGYSGLAELQFVGTSDGPALIDVNTRFYGSLPLALAAGVNLPAAWHATVSGGPAPRPGSYRVGVSYRWLEADLTAALRGAPGPLFERTARPRAGSMWASDDPLASALLAASAVGVRVRRRLPAYRRASP